jgi:hypothetical protein
VGGAVVLDCELDLAAIRPGSYQVWVVNDASHESARWAFNVVSGAPVLDTVSPSSLKPNPGAGDPRGVTVFGSGFDITSKVWFTGTGVAAASLNTTFVDPGKLLVALVDLTTLCGAAPCPVTSGTVRYFLEVRNGAVASGPKELLVATTTASVASAMSPTTVWQGDTDGGTSTVRTVTVSGSGLTGSVLQYHRPGAADFVDAAGTATATSVTGALDLIGAPPGSAPAGQWDVRVRFADATLSGPFTLQVQSNQAFITATPSPAGGTAGATVPVTLTVSNLRPPQAGVRVRFYDPAGATSLEPTPLSFPAADKVVVSLPLAGLETKVYALSVVNPNGALPSAPYNFTVFPGAPTLGSVACTSVTGAPPGCTSATSARLQATPVPVRVLGTNFARADAAGNNGSQLRISSAALGVVDFLVPLAAVTVTSATQLDVQLDTLLAVPGTYDVQVWNQGGALESNTLVGAFTILP